MFKSLSGDDDGCTFGGFGSGVLGLDAPGENAKGIGLPPEHHTARRPCQ